MNMKAISLTCHVHTRMRAPGVGAGLPAIGRHRDDRAPHRGQTRSHNSADCQAVGLWGSKAIGAIRGDAEQPC